MLTIAMRTPNLGRPPPTPFSVHMNVVIIGATGLVGSQILKHAEASAAITGITTFSRRAVGGDKVHSVVKESTDEWYPEIEKLGSGPAAPQAFFSAFGTTKAQAGGIENFKRIDHGTNLAAAKAAKQANIDTFVLVSSMGASRDSMFPYLKIKGELEDDIKALGFKRFVILRPGALLGDRPASKGLGNTIAAKLGSFTRGTPLSFLLKPVYAEEIGKVAVHLATQPLSAEPEVDVLEASDIITLAKDIKA
jgi:uncharacterized protein YbjT (DUF2867 family)